MYIVCWVLEQSAYRNWDDICMEKWWYLYGFSMLPIMTTLAPSPCLFVSRGKLYEPTHLWQGADFNNAPPQHSEECCQHQCTTAVWSTLKNAVYINVLQLVGSWISHYPLWSTLKNAVNINALVISWFTLCPEGRDSLLCSFSGLTCKVCL